MRQLLAVASQIVRDCYAQHGEPAAILDSAQQEILALSLERRKTDSVPLREALCEVQRQIDDRAKGLAPTGIMTGLIDLDVILGGLQPGEVTIIAAATSVGKTAFAGHICRELAESGGASLIFALEMDARQMAGRWLCGQADVASTVLRFGRPGAGVADRLIEAAGVLSPLPIWINDQPGRTIQSILASARQLLARVPLRLLVNCSCPCCC